MNSAIRDEFIVYQNKYKDILKELISDNAKTSYRDWKGFITLDGPVVERPAILFLGINPGPGLYKEVNPENEAGIIPFRMLEYEKYNYSAPFNSQRIVFAKPISRSDENKTISLDWFTKGNYRKINNELQPWYNGGCKNSFVWNMVKVVCRVAELKYHEKFIKGTRPKWYDNEEFGKSIMHLNLYPIATENTAGLGRILKELKSKKISVEIEPLRALVTAIKPQVIVFEGKTAYDMFMSGQRKGEVVEKLARAEYEGIPAVVFRRDRGWSSDSNLKKIADEIYKHLK